MKHLTRLLTSLLLLIAFTAQPQSSCLIRNKAIGAGEQIQFFVYYTLAGIWVHAGTATFTVKPETLNNKPVFHIVGDGATLPSYDWIFRVRDRYETYIDTQTLLPKRFIRNVDEGGYRMYENITFYHENKTAVTNKGVFTIPECVQDVMSEMYLARNMNFDKLKPGDMLPFDLFLDNKVYNVYIRYLGKEVVKTRYGKFRCIKMKPLLLKGSIFEGGEKMTVWVTDDANRLPVRIESPILVGNIKVDMMSYHNLRYPLTSLIDIR